MLILRRRVGEAIELDGPGRVTLIKVDGRNRAVWGIEAPQSTRILRSELQDSELGECERSVRQSDREAA